MLNRLAALAGPARYRGKLFGTEAQSGTGGAAPPDFGRRPLGSPRFNLTQGLARAAGALAR